MEEQEVKNQVQQAPVNPASAKPDAKSYLANSNYCIIGGIILVLLLILSTIYVRSLPSRKPISLLPKPLASPSPLSPTPDPTANWKTYRNEELGLEVKYPPSYSVNEFRFSPEMPIVSVSFMPEKYSSSKGQLGIISIEKLHDQLDSNIKTDDYIQNVLFKDHFRGAIFKSLTKEKMGDVVAYRVFVQHKPEGESSQTFVRAGNGLYYFIFQQGADPRMVPSQAKNYSDYEAVISTFKFLDQENQVVCTQDAKLCPDGSYVSRQPPTCEFAKCP